MYARTHRPLAGAATRPGRQRSRSPPAAVRDSSSDSSTAGHRWRLRLGASTKAATTTTTAAPAAGGASTVKLSADADGALAFDTTTLTAKAGKVTLDMANPGELGHPARDRGRGQRGRQGRPDRAAGRLVEGHRHAEARDVPVLLPDPRSQGGGDGRNADRLVTCEQDVTRSSIALVADPHPGGALRRLNPDDLGDHLDRLYRAAWALCGDRHEAEDLVQDTYAAVLARPRWLRGERRPRLPAARAAQHAGEPRACP